MPLPASPARSRQPRPVPPVTPGPRQPGPVSPPPVETTCEIDALCDSDIRIRRSKSHNASKSHDNPLRLSHVPPPEPHQQHPHQHPSGPNHTTPPARQNGNHNPETTRPNFPALHPKGALRAASPVGLGPAGRKPPAGSRAWGLVAPQTPNGHRPGAGEAGKAGEVGKAGTNRHKSNKKGGRHGHQSPPLPSAIDLRHRLSGPGRRPAGRWRSRTTGSG